MEDENELCFLFLLLTIGRPILYHSKNAGCEDNLSFQFQSHIFELQFAANG